MKGLKNMGKNSRRNKNKNKINTISGTPIMRNKAQGALPLPPTEGESKGTPVQVSKGPAVGIISPKPQDTPANKTKSPGVPNTPAPTAKTEAKLTPDKITEAQKLEAQMMAWNYLNKTHYGQFKEAELGDHSIPGQALHNWFIQGDSTYLIHKNRIGMFGVKTSDKGMPGLPTMISAPAFIKLYVPKIPEHIYRQIISFFKKVMEKVSNSEAFAQVYYDTTERTYLVHIPEQTVSGARVSYDNQQNLDILDNDRYIFVFECHSHNSMAAFFSGVDDADEKDTRIYGVFGELNREVYAEKFRIVVNGNYLTLSAKQIFDIDEPKPIDFPKEWLDKVKPAYSRPSYYNAVPNNQYGYGNVDDRPTANNKPGGSAGHRRFPSRDYDTESGFPSSADYEFNNRGNNFDSKYPGMDEEEKGMIDTDVDSEMMQEVEVSTDEIIQLTDGFTSLQTTWAFANTIHQYGMAEDVKKALDEYVG